MIIEAYSDNGSLYEPNSWIEFGISFFWWLKCVEPSIFWGFVIFQFILTSSKDQKRDLPDSHEWDGLSMWFLYWVISNQYAHCRIACPGKLFQLAWSAWNKLWPMRPQLVRRCGAVWHRNCIKENARPNWFPGKHQIHLDVAWATWTLTMFGHGWGTVSFVW